MTKKIFALFVRYRELVLYGIFGVLTTIVNWASYKAFMMALSGIYANVASVSIAWVISVLFAYFTNRKWVFESRATGRKAQLKECGAFFSSRAFSGLIDLGIMFAAVDLLHYDGDISKLASNVLVIIINYLLSKFIIFKKK